jgi:hypothetical protein
MDTNLPVTHLIVNHPCRVVWEGLLASFQPSMRPTDLNFQWRIEDQRISIQLSPWGDIGFLVIKELAKSQVDIQFYLPPFPTQQEAKQIESAIRAEIMKHKRTTGDLVNNPELALQYLTNALHDHKLSLLIRIRNWLASALGIWGLMENRPIPFIFSFVIDGTPAQFAILLRYFFPNYRSPEGLSNFEVKVMRSNSLPLQEIPLDINPILVDVSYFRSEVVITVHTMPNLRSLLRVELAANSLSWGMWDAIRDEMARVSWFHLPEVPESLLAETNETASQKTIQPIADRLQEPWQVIPDTGSDRLVVQLWNESKTSKEIGQKVGSTGKTILNRINQLRSEFGPQIVPYRKVSKTRDKQAGK